MHQSCYGIPILSEEDWLCNLCLAYPKEKVFNVQCLVCPVLGGAMKLCNINKSSRFYQEVQQIRNSKSKFPSNQDINSSDHLISSEQDVKSIQFSMGSTLLKKNLSEDQEELKDEEVTIDNIINNLERLNLDDSCNNTPSIAFKSSEKENIFEDCSLESQHFSNLNRNAKKEEIEKDSKSKKMNSPQLSHYNPIIGKPKIVKKLKNKNCLRAKLSKLSKFVYLVRQKDFVNKNAENLAWIHVTCALWNPQIRVKNFKNKEGISGK